MTVWDVVNAHPWLAFFSLVVVVTTGDNVAANLARCATRKGRQRNIALHGWPPPHLDADGDFRSKPDGG